MACSVCRCASGSLTGITQRLKLFYALIFTSAVVVAFLLRFYGQDAFVELSSFKLGCTGERCYGVQAAYRLSFALAVFFSTMAGVTVCVPVSHCWRVVRTCVRARALLAPGCSPGVWAVGGLARLVRERSPADNCCPPPPPLRPSIRARLAQWFHSSLHIVKLIYFLVLAVVTFFIPAGESHRLAAVFARVSAPCQHDLLNLPTPLRKASGARPAQTFSFGTPPFPW